MNKMIVDKIIIKQIFSSYLKLDKETIQAKDDLSTAYMKIIT